MIEKDSFIPMYQQIFTILKGKIEEGIYEAGTKLPTEMELIKEFQVSRTTVRLAVAELMESNLVERKAGKGTFVKKHKIYHGLDGFKGLFENLLEAGVDLHIEVLSIKKTVPDKQVTKALQIGEEEALMIERLYYVNGIPIALAQISVHPKLSESITREDVEKYPIHQFIEKKLGFSIKEAHLEVFAENASDKVAEVLLINKGEAVLGAERILYAEDDQPVEHSLLKFRSNAYRFTLGLQTSNKLKLSAINQFNPKKESGYKRDS